MADTKPSKEDIQVVFKKLRAIPTNKSCFDCDAKNPTWASVTYGVFICIDCSAVHRSLGVHLTFVRSTQLDTNWSWIQLRQMQLGGNASASVFFRQHNCVTSDAPQKYNSRAAQLYRDKLTQMANSSLRLHGTELHIEPVQDKQEVVNKEVDFFEEHASFTSLVDTGDGALATLQQNQTVPDVEPVRAASAAAPATIDGRGPSVDLTSAQPAVGERKSIIGGRKPPAKKTGLGAKKGGLGAQRVQTNFADIERQAEMSDQRKSEKQVLEVKVAPEEEEQQLVSMRLAYQDLSMGQHKEEERLKKSDPKKAQQVERLGMGFTSGFSAKSGISHSALSDMKTIEQEVPVKGGGGLGKSTYDSESGDDFLDDFLPVSFGMFRNTPTSHSDKLAEYLESTSSAPNRDRYTPREEKTSTIPSSKSWYDGMSESRSRPPASSTAGAAPASSVDAQKKFGNAKAISSDQYFGPSADNSYEVKANLSRFEGSTSISSSDYFGDGRSSGGNRSYNTGGISNSISAPDLDDVKESVRQGVTKVAGKISSLANGMLTSIQDRYGY